jgi:hypothetical protein
MTYIGSKLYKHIDTIRLLHICILLFVQKQYVTMNFIMGLLECFVRICEPDMFISYLKELHQRPYFAIVHEYEIHKDCI